MLAQPILAFAMVLNGALRGAGDTRPGLVGTVIGRGIIVVPLAYVLALPLGLWRRGGVVGAFCGHHAFRRFTSWMRWRRGRWVGVALHKTPLYRRHLHALPKSAQRRFLETVRTPLMARDDATEEVNPAGVIYTAPGSVVKIAFTEDDYTVSETVPEEQRVPTPEPAPRAAPAYRLGLR